jgi:peptidoglycan hydrolase-like protein with peptidoglycan-binding domain
MKMRHIVVATAAALISFGAIAEGQRHQSQSSGTTAPQAQSDATLVREAQQKLRDAGYAATPQGLREFQQANGIEASGQLDAQTLAALGVDASAASGASSETPKN